MPFAPPILFNFSNKNSGLYFFPLIEIGSLFLKPIFILNALFFAFSGEIVF